MRFSLALTATAACSITWASAQSDACPDYAILNARGTSQPQGPDQGTRSMVSQTLAALTGGVSYNVVYPATLQFELALEGANDISRYVKAALSQCPKQKFAVLGYSQGAIAVALALAQLQPTSAYDQIKAVLVIGNPGRVAGSSANVDQNGGELQRNAEGLFYNGGYLAIPGAYYDSGKVLDICYVGDWICAKGSSSGANIPHGLYGTDEKVQKMGSDFLVSKLQGTPSNSTSTSAMSSTVNGTMSSTTASGSTAPTPYPAGNSTVSVTATATGTGVPSTTLLPPVATRTPSSLGVSRRDVSAGLAAVLGCAAVVLLS